MRVLHTADWHFGRTLEGRSRQEEQEAFVDELVQMVEEESIDLVLMAGDAYDSVNPPAASETLFYEALSRLADKGRRQVVVISGNHDNPERLAASAPLAHTQGITLLGLPSMQLLELGTPRTGELAQIFALPYPSEARLRELLSEEADEQSLRTAYSARVGDIVERAASGFRPGCVHMTMSHLYVLGGAETDSERPIQVGGAYTVDPAALTRGMPQYVALGHLHRPQTVKADTVMRYSGSPLAYSFSEAGQAKSVTVFELVPGMVAEPREVLLSSGRPLVKWKAKGGIAELHRWLDEGLDARAWIDLELHMTEALSMEQIQTIRRQHAGILHIRPVYPEMEREVVHAERGLPIDEMFKRFYSRQTGGAEPEPELVELFLQLLQDEPAEPRDAEEEALA